MKNGKATKTSTTRSARKGDDISITLSPGQIEQVMRSAGQTRNGTVSNLLLAALDNAYKPGSSGNGGAKSLQKATQEALEDALTDPQLSQSLLRGLAILSSYGPDRPWRAIIDLAQQLGMSPSTTHRYVKTLRAVGLLEQNPTTREYRPVAR
jgi:predicted transcriptional regulator